MFLAGVSLMGGACSPSGEASHLPHPVLLPGMAVGAALENAAYGARRAKVKAHVSAEFAQITAQIAQGAGPALTKAFDLARVAAPRRAALSKMLQDDPRLRRDPEALTVSLMVHGP